MIEHTDRTAASAERPLLQGASLLVNPGRSGWSVPNTTAWANEATLRDLLVEHPSLLPGVIDPAAAAVEELGIPGVGRVDVVAVESTGVITVCEAKLSTNPEIRREIVGQVLAYASGLTGWNVDDFDAAWYARCGQSFVESVLGDGAAGEDAAALRDAVTATLETGAFRLVLAVDQMTDELRSIVTYLADHMNGEVAALQMAYARSGDVEIIVPQVWGMEIASERSRRTGQRASKGYRSALSEALPAIIEQGERRATGYGAALETILRRIEPLVSTLYSGAEDMLDPVLVAHAPPERQPAKVITSQKTIGLRVCFHWCSRLPVEVKEAALRTLEAHPAIAPHVTEVRGAEFRKGPLIPYVGCLDQPGAADVVAEALTVLFKPVQ